MKRGRRKKWREKKKKVKNEDEVGKERLSVEQEEERNQVRTMSVTVAVSVTIHAPVTSDALTMETFAAPDQLGFQSRYCYHCWCMKVILELLPGWHSVDAAVVASKPN